MQISDQQQQHTKAPGINDLAAGLFETLALRFPVCMSSDEFHYYPQAAVINKDWSQWDNFSPESVTDFFEVISVCKLKLDQMVSAELTFDEQVDISLLKRSIKTLLEQLMYAQPHKTHPGFYLTLIGIGLAEAFDAGLPALNDRLKGLPGLIRQAQQNLEKVHEIFKNQGCEMTARLCSWIATFPVDQKIRSVAIQALEDFNVFLHTCPGRKDFLVPKDLYEEILAEHMGCFMSVYEIERCIAREIRETASLVKEYTSGIFPDISWQRLIAELSYTLPHHGSVMQAYRACVSGLGSHCIDKGIVSPDAVKRCPVHVETVPEYMLPVRSNAAYTMPPGHPPRGGTFFIIESDNNKIMPSDYRFLTAHETYPGHHLLDSSRWLLHNLVRRHMEFPVFYEGWACIAEEILFDTGFFSNSFDRMLSAKRRLWRALRGKIDLDIHTRKKSLSQAAAFLSEYGMSHAKALELVRKYIVKPGYQLSYSIGRYYFRNLYELFIRIGGQSADFVCRVLSHGEVGFDHLSQYLRTGGDS